MKKGHIRIQNQRSATTLAYTNGSHTRGIPPHGATHMSHQP